MKFWNSAVQYAKGIIVVTAAVVSSLAPYYGHQPWFPALVSGLGAAGAILIPNQPKQ